MGATADMATEFLSQLVPDMFEIHTRTPLRSPELPIHSTTERKERDDAAKARLGLVNLFNALLSIRVSIGDLTRIVVLILRLKNVQRRLFQKIGDAAFLWVLVGSNLFRLATLVPLLGEALLRRRKLRKKEKPLDQMFSNRVLQAAMPLFTGIAFIFLLLTWLLPIYLVVWGGLLVLWFAVFYGTSRTRGKSGFTLMESVLDHFAIRTDLGNAHFLKQYFVRLFDPDFYAEALIRDVVKAALDNEGSIEGTEKQRRLIGQYADRPQQKDRIHVAVMAADISQRGDMMTIAGDVPVVDALMAATAVTPLFKSQRVSVETDGSAARRKAWCVDATNIGNEPTFGLISLLRRRVDRNARTALIYPVASLPVMFRVAARRVRGRVGLHEGGRRGVQSDATPGFSGRPVRAPTGGVVYAAYACRPRFLAPGANGNGDGYVCARVLPIEPDRATDLNGRLAQASSDNERRRLVREAMADGCRAALEAMLAQTIKEVADGPGFRTFPLAIGGDTGGTNTSRARR